MQKRAARGPRCFRLEITFRLLWLVSSFVRLRQFLLEHGENLLALRTVQALVETIQGQAHDVIVVQATQAPGPRSPPARFCAAVPDPARANAACAGQGNTPSTLWSGEWISSTMLGRGSGSRSQASPVSLPCSSSVSLLERPQTMREDSSRCRGLHNSVEDIGRGHHHQRNVLALLLGQLHHLGEQLLLVLVEQLLAVIAARCR